MAVLKIADIIEPRSFLRLVDKTRVDYLELKSSIAAHGLINSICVRPSERVPGKYEIMEGMHRYLCHVDLGLEEIEAIIKDVSDDDVLVLQIQANAVRPETRPVEFADALKRLLARKPDMTIVDLSGMVKKSPRWVKDILGLLRLKREIQKEVDAGRIPMKSAYMLAKLPYKLQSEQFENAKTMTATMFVPLAASVLKNFCEAVKLGKLEEFYERQFEVRPYLRSLREVTAELEEPTVGGIVLAAEGCRSAVDGFYAALRWVAHLDRGSVQEQERAARSKQEKQLRNASTRKSSRKRSAYEH